MVVCYFPQNHRIVIISLCNTEMQLTRTTSGVIILIEEKAIEEIQSPFCFL